MIVNPILKTWVIIKYSFYRRERSFKCGLPLSEEHYLDKPTRYQTIITHSKNLELRTIKTETLTKSKEKRRGENEQSFHVIV